MIEKDGDIPAAILFLYTLRIFTDETLDSMDLTDEEREELQGAAKK